VRQEGLGKLKKIHLVGSSTRDLPACSGVPQPLRYSVRLRLICLLTTNGVTRRIARQILRALPRGTSQEPKSDGFQESLRVPDRRDLGAKGVWAQTFPKAGFAHLVHL
jgi:hypothetical protein